MRDHCRTVYSTLAIAGAIAAGMRMESIALPSFVKLCSGFVEIAAELAGDETRLKAHHDDLRNRVSASALMDRGRFAREMERAYRFGWRNWCES
jgi:predicted O-linked N-acetylglucosamine transferase (SPINDLY family)